MDARWSVLLGGRQRARATASCSVINRYYKRREVLRVSQTPLQPLCECSPHYHSAEFAVGLAFCGFRVKAEWKEVRGP